MRNPWIDRMGFCPDKTDYGGFTHFKPVIAVDAWE